MTHANAKHFWDWFQQNNEKLKIISGQTQKENKYWYRELCAHLKSYCGGNLYPQVIVDEEKNRAGMIITAHGDPKYFSKIEKLVEKAPTITGWSFVALSPPMPAHAGLAYNFPSVTVQPDEMFFAPVELVLVEGRYNLEVYVAEDAEIDKELSGAVARVVYNVLGEKTAGLNIREVAVSYLEAASPTVQQAVVPLTQLPDFIPSDMLSRLMVDDTGTVKPRIRR